MYLPCRQGFGVLTVYAGVWCTESSSVILCITINAGPGHSTVTDVATGREV